MKKFYVLAISAIVLATAALIFSLGVIRGVGKKLPSTKPKKHYVEWNKQGMPEDSTESKIRNKLPPQPIIRLPKTNIAAIQEHELAKKRNIPAMSLMEFIARNFPDIPIATTIITKDMIIREDGEEEEEEELDGLARVLLDPGTYPSLPDLEEERGNAYYMPLGTYFPYPYWWNGNRDTGGAIFEESIADEYFSGSADNVSFDICTVGNYEIPMSFMFSREANPSSFVVMCPAYTCDFDNLHVDIKTEYEIKDILENRWVINKVHAYEGGNFTWKSKTFNALFDYFIESGTGAIKDYNYFTKTYRWKIPLILDWDIYIKYRYDRGYYVAPSGLSENVKKWADLLDEYSDGEDDNKIVFGTFVTLMEATITDLKTGEVLYRLEGVTPTYTIKDIYLPAVSYILDINTTHEAAWGDPTMACYVDNLIQWGYWVGIDDRNDPCYDFDSSCCGFPNSAGCP